MDVQTEIIKTDKNQDTFLQGAKDCLPTLLGYMSIGIAFGVVGAASNLNLFEVALLAIFVYAGSAQFIICALLVVNTPLTVIILTTFIVNLRHLLLSLTLAPYFTRYSTLKNIGFGALLTDESFGVAATKAARDGKLNDKWMNGLNMTAYLSWITACIVGAFSAQWISNPEALGLDFALPAMFIALLVLQFQNIMPHKLKHSLSLIVYMVIAMILFSLLVPTYVAVILATTIVATIGVVTDK